MFRTLTIFILRNKGWVVFLVLILVMAVIYTRVGVYTIQPMGVLPEGVTMIVLRGPGEPFFNSPDAVCIRTEGEVSLLCRGTALSQAPNERVILRLPFWNWAYLQSTGSRVINY